MKKHKNRQKLLLRLMIFTVLVAVLQEVWARYEVHKADLTSDIEIKQDEIQTFLDKLTEEDPEKLRKAIDNDTKVLARYYQRIIEKPNESEVSLFIRENITRVAEQSGIELNSINTQRGQPLEDELPVHAMRVRFRFRGNLDAVLNFFKACDDQSYYLAVETVSINPQRQRRSRRRNSEPEDPEERMFSGNGIFSTLYVPLEGQDGSIVEEKQLEALEEDQEDDLDPGDADADSDGESESIPLIGKTVPAKSGGGDAKQSDSPPQKKDGGKPAPTAKDPPKDQPQAGKKSEPKPEPKKESPSPPKKGSESQSLKVGGDDKGTTGGLRKVEPAKSERPRLEPKPKPLSGDGKRQKNKTNSNE